MKKLILWDLDGTLIDTLEDLGAAVDHALKLRGLPVLRTEDYRRMVGHGVRNLVQQALETAVARRKEAVATDGGIVLDEGYINAALEDFKTFYSAHIDVHTRPYPGMPELLTELQSRGVRMAVTSNKFQEGTERLVREFFPDIDFVAILGNSPELPLKPSPEIVKKVLEAVGEPQSVGQSDNDSDPVDDCISDFDEASRTTTVSISDKSSRGAAITAADAVLVGDSPTDMRTARNGGIEAIAVSWGYRSAEELAGNPIVNSVGELRDMLIPFYVSEPVPTPPAAFSTALQRIVYERFNGLEIPFTRVDTDPGITMEDCRHIDERIGVRIVKTLFLCNRQQTQFYLYVTSDDKPFVTRDFCAVMGGIPRVSFASAEKLWELTGVQVGATTILSAILPSAAGVQLVMDRTIAGAEWFACTDGTPTCFVRLRTGDLLGKYLSERIVKLI